MHNNAMGTRIEQVSWSDQSHPTVSMWCSVDAAQAVHLRARVRRAQGERVGTATGERIGELA
ncbi:MAG: hypothetical protein ACRDRL_00980 [Sciscionella sp.]